MYFPLSNSSQTPPASLPTQLYASAFSLSLSLKQKRKNTKYTKQKLMQSLRRCFCYYYFLQCKTIFNILIYLFLTSLLNLQGFPFTYSSSCHPQPRPPSPAPYPSSSLQRLPQKKIKQVSKQTNKAITKCPPKPKQNQNHSRNRQIPSSLLTFYHLFICPDDTGGFGVSYSRPLCLTSSTSKCSLQ